MEMWKHELELKKQELELLKRENELLAKDNELLRMEFMVRWTGCLASNACFSSMHLFELGSLAGTAGTAGWHKVVLACRSRCIYVANGGHFLLIL